MSVFLFWAVKQGVTTLNSAKEVEVGSTVQEENVAENIIRLPDLSSNGIDAVRYRNAKYEFEFQYPHDWIVLSSSTEAVVLRPGMDASGFVGIHVVDRNVAEADIESWRQRLGLAAWENRVSVGGVKGISSNPIRRDAYISLALINFLKDGNVYEVEWYDNEIQNSKVFNEFIGLTESISFKRVTEKL